MLGKILDNSLYCQSYEENNQELVESQCERRVLLSYNESVV